MKNLIIYISLFLLTQASFGQCPLNRLVNEINSNAQLKNAIKNNPDLIDSWKKLDELGSAVPNSVKSDPNMLKSFDLFSSNSRAQKHVFEGEINGIGRATGVHHINAIQSGTARKVSGTQVSGPNGLYKAKVEVKNSIGSWVPKTANGGFSTFFPDTWSLDRTIAEIAHARKTKVPVSGNEYKGTSMDGTININMYLRSDGSIISAFPSF